MLNTKSIRAAAVGSVTFLVGCGSSPPSSSSSTPPASLCAGVVCSASDDCHVAGVCDEATGTCSNPVAPDGTACATGSCSAGACVVTALCTDGVRDGAETDVDCGGPACAPCVDGKACTAPTDCLTAACTGVTCGAPPSALIADTGERRNVDSGAHVVLDGSHSRAPVGPIAAFTWQQTAGPAVTLTGAASANPSFDAPTVDDAGALLTFALTVSDATGATATSSLDVIVSPSTGAAPTTSQGLIRKALDEGTIDRDTAAQYFAFALFGDARLPAAYVGSDPGMAGTWTARFLVAALPTLTPATQQVLLPYLLPPNAPGAASASGASTTSTARTSPEKAPASPTWIAVASDHVVIWYPSDLPNGATLATSLSTEVETGIWPVLLSVWGNDHMPLTTDAGFSLFRGGMHGKLNIYLDRGINDDGATVPYGSAPTPTYIQLDTLNGTRPLSSKSPVGLFQLAAHEITHACQDSYAGSLDDAATWLAEGTATWAEDFVYPSVNSEQRAASAYLQDTWMSLDSTSDLRHAYGTYLFFQDITKGANGSQFVSRAFAGLGSSDPLTAANAAFIGGADFSVYWSQFLPVAWNRTPGANFQIDNLMIGATPYTGAARVLALPGTDGAYSMPAEVGHLSAMYDDFTFKDSSLRSVFFYDGLYFNLQVKTASDGTEVVAPVPLSVADMRGETTHLLTLKDKVWTDHPTTLPTLGGVQFCRDNPAENIEEVVAIFGDSVPDKSHLLRPQGLKPRLWVSNIGCYRWQGTIDAQTSPTKTGVPFEQITSNVTLARYAADAGTGLFMFTASAQISWQISGTVGECSYSGSDSWTWSQPAPVVTLAPTALPIPDTTYRTFSCTTLGGDHQVSYEETCTLPDGTQTTTTSTKSPIWWDCRDPLQPTWKPQISASGTNVTATVDDGSMQYSWNLNSVAGP